MLPKNSEASLSDPQRAHREHFHYGRFPSIRFHGGWILIAALLLIVLSTVAAQTVHAAPTDNSPITDDAFVRDAFFSNQTEIEISRIALDRATADKKGNPAIKKLATAVIKDHTAANEQLRALANEKRLTLPTLLDGQGKQQVERLKNLSTQDLDTAYREQMQQHQDAAIVLFDRVAKNPRSDAELRVFAAKMLPILHKHQQMIAKIGAPPAKAVNASKAA